MLPRRQNLQEQCLNGLFLMVITAHTPTVKDGHILLGLKQEQHTPLRARYMLVVAVEKPM